MLHVRPGFGCIAHKLAQVHAATKHMAACIQGLKPATECQGARQPTQYNSSTVKDYLPAKIVLQSTINGTTQNASSSCKSRSAIF